MKQGSSPKKIKAQETLRELVFVVAAGFHSFFFPVTSPVVGRGGLRAGSLPSVVLNTAWLLHIPLPQSSPQEAAGPALGALPATQLQKSSRQPVRSGGTWAGRNSVRMQALMETREPQLGADWARKTDGRAVSDMLGVGAAATRGLMTLSCSL